MDDSHPTDEPFAYFVESLRHYGATSDEITELVETTDVTDPDVIDTDALAHERLASLRGVPSIY